MNYNKIVWSFGKYILTKCSCLYSSHYNKLRIWLQEFIMNLATCITLLLSLSQEQQQQALSMIMKCCLYLMGYSVLSFSSFFIPMLCLLILKHYYTSSIINGALEFLLNCNLTACQLANRRTVMKFKMILPLLQLHTSSSTRRNA